MELAEGVILLGRYRLEHVLGSGTMGQVWAARDTSVGIGVAVKTLRRWALANAEVLMRFRREAYLLARVRNEHCARVLDFEADEEHGLVLVMDLIEGERLLEVLKARRLSVEEAIDLGCDLLRGLGELHAANVVHRDLKPANVILERLRGGRTRAVIVDFGMGRMMAEQVDGQAPGITDAHMALGTMEYMSPEQVLNSRNVTGTADLYAVGALLYRAVTGEHVYGARKEQELALAKLKEPAPALVTGRGDPRAIGFAAVIERALRRVATERFESADGMLDALLALREPVPLPAAPAPVPIAPAPPPAVVVPMTPVTLPQGPVVAPQGKAPLLPIAIVSLLFGVGLGAALMWVLGP